MRIFIVSVVFLCLQCTFLAAGSGKLAGKAGKAHVSFSDRHSLRDSVLVKNYLDSARSKAAQNQLDSAESYFLRAGTLAKEIKYYAGLFKFYGAYATFLYRQLRFKDVLKVSGEHLALAKERKNKAMMADAYNNLGVQYHALGDLHLSAENYILAMRTAETLPDHKNSHKYYSNLASIFLDLKDKDKALYYARKGYQTASQMGDSARIGSSLVNLSCSEIINERYEDARAHLHQMMAIAQKKKNVALEIDACINLGEIGMRRKEYDKALEWNQKAYSLMDETLSPDYATYIYDGLAKSYFYMNDLEKADEFFEKSLKNAEAQDWTQNELKELYLFGAQLKEKINKPAVALYLRKKYDVMKDSILSDIRQASVREMELKYQTTLKEKTLAQQQLVIAYHENEIQKKNKLIILTVSTLCLLGCIGVVVFLYYRHRRRISNAQKQGLLLQAQIQGEEQERARQARELHDGVAGILSAAKLQLSLLQLGKTDDENKAVYEKALSLLMTASGEVRNISHNLAPEILLQEGLEFAISDFCKRVCHPSLVIDFYAVVKIPKLSTTLELLIYRIVQESVYNIIKHAKATRAIVQLSLLENALSVSIEDNGVGFDLHNIASKGIGLHNLMSRIQIMGGSCEISSGPGKGTMIYIVCDVSRYLKQVNETAAPEAEYKLVPNGV